jgi:hypothetical protein
MTKWVLGISVFAIAIGLAATATIMPAPAAVSIDDVSLKFLPPETKGVVFVDVIGLRSAPLFQQAVKSGNVVYPDSVESFIKKTGFDPERDLEKVIFAKLPDTGQGILIAQGRIDKNKIEGFVKEQGKVSESYLGHTLYQDGDKTYVFFENVAVAGPKSAVKKAIDQMQLPGSQPLSSDLQAAIRTIEAGNQVWAAGDVTVQDFNAVGVRGPAPVLDMLRSLHSGTYQMRVDTGIHARATGDFSDAESARSVGDVANGLLAIARVQVGRQKQELVQLLDGVQVSSSGPTITVRIEVPGEALKGLKDYRSTIGRVLQ